MKRLALVLVWLLSGGLCVNSEKRATRAPNFEHKPDLSCGDDVGWCDPDEYP